MNLRTTSLCLTLLCAPAAHAASKSDKAAGAALYKTSGCEHCHGANLAGTDEGVSLQGIGKTATRDELTHQIVHGGGGMPPFRDALNDVEIARLIDFLASQKKLPKGSKPSGTPTPAATPKPKPNPDDSGD